MIMKRRTYLIICLCLALVFSCAKVPPTGKNDDAKTYLDAWIKVNHPDAVTTELGAFKLSETPGSGVPAADSLYLRINYSYYTLDEELVATTYEKVARRCGTYKKNAWYGPSIIWRGQNKDNLAAGLEEAVNSMNVGGKMRVVIPGWLSTTKRYANAEEYLAKATGTDYIYDIEIVDALNDTEVWERDSLRRFIEANYPGAKEDSTGFWSVVLSDPHPDSVIPADTTLQINYTGRLLNGRVFDTTIADTAARHGIYSSSKTYATQRINWFSSSENWDKITMGTDSGSLIAGFKYGLSLMHKGEKALFFFTSSYGYGANGSGSSIPGYSPLCFELEITEE